MQSERTLKRRDEYKLDKLEDKLLLEQEKKKIEKRAAIDCLVRILLLLIV